MRIILDTADHGEIRWALAMGLADGVTTNASRMEHGVTDGDAYAHIADICRLVTGPVMVDVRSVQADEMYREGRDLAKLGDNVVVSVPMIEEGILAMRQLARDGIRVNTTLVFSAAQALLAAKAGATYVSPSVRGPDETGNDGLGLVRRIREIFDNYVLECEILAASIADAYHFIEAAHIGADLASVSPALLRSLLLHPLTDRYLDQSLNAWSRHIAQSRAGV
ncbi:MAG TPA: transaldolase family protein [Gemmatimonadaceae bacterium]|jgi:transaldolase|nr:transaldolase family protein [Gemmatimonadaceae bacterium]